MGIKRVSNKDRNSGFFENLVESDGWLTADEAAYCLRMSVNALRIATCRGRVPHYKVGRRVRYKRTDIHELPQLVPFENVLVRPKQRRK